jgi:hypothetical protein
LRVMPLGANTTHAPLLDLLAVVAHAIGAIHAQASGPLAWSPFT